MNRRSILKAIAALPAVGVFGIRGTEPVVNEAMLNRAIEGMETARYVPYSFGASFRITDEMLADDRYGAWDKLVREHKGHIEHDMDAALRTLYFSGSDDPALKEALATIPREPIEYDDEDF